jgi:hypothetical protein
VIFLLQSESGSNSSGFFLDEVSRGRNFVTLMDEVKLGQALRDSW